MVYIIIEKSNLWGYWQCSVGTTWRTHIAGAYAGSCIVMQCIMCKSTGSHGVQSSINAPLNFEIFEQPKYLADTQKA